jgi:Ca2+-binding RTX toxin-like protein
MMFPKRPQSEEEKHMIKETIDRLKGAANAGKAVAFFANSADQLPKIESLPTNGNDKLWAGRDFSGINSTVFAGAGNDEIDVPVGGASKGFNRIDAGSGLDVIFAGNGDRVSGGSGNDELDATDATGYRLSGGKGDDIFYLGENGRAIGGEGNDQFYVGEGGDNLLSGGAGADQFWLLSDVAPDTANTVVDFTQGPDVLGIAGQGAGVNFASLTRTGNSIALNGDVFATLNGFDATTLTAADFVFI